MRYYKIVFAKVLLIFGINLFAGDIFLSQSSVTELITTSSKPITISTNFNISTADLIITNEKFASLRLLKKGFIIIPKKKDLMATVVITAMNGEIYTISISGIGNKAVFKLSDPMQVYDTRGIKIEFESGRMDRDAKNIIKTILLEKKLAGFEKTFAFQKVQAKDYVLQRIERYTGGKYVVDRWSIRNTSQSSIYFEEEDFYTEGILAVAIEKNTILTNEEIFLITILNKHSVYEAEKRD